MANVTQVDRKHVGSNNYEYTFECSCESETTHRLTVTVGGTADQKANALAEIECNERCGEA